MRRLCALALFAALGAAFFAFPAEAQQTRIQWFDPLYNMTKTVTPSDPLPMSDYARDRDYPLIMNLVSAVNLGLGGQLISPARGISQYTRAALLLNWSGVASADSDSTVIGVRVYGKTSTTSGNRYLWTPYTQLTSSLDTCFCKMVVADSASAAGWCPNPQVSFFIIRAANGQGYLTVNGSKIPASFVGGTASTRVNLRKAPPWAVRYAGYNGVMLNLTDQSGAPCPFPYIEVELTNLSFSRVLNSVQLDIWPRVQ